MLDWEGLLIHQLHGQLPVYLPFCCEADIVGLPRPVCKPANKSSLYFFILSFCSFREFSSVLITFSTAVTKYHYQGNLQKKGLIWTYGSRGTETMIAKWSHNCSHTHTHTHTLSFSLSLSKKMNRVFCCCFSWNFCKNTEDYFDDSCIGKAIHKGKDFKLYLIKMIACSSPLKGKKYQHTQL